MSNKLFVYKQTVIPGRNLSNALWNAISPCVFRTDNVVTIAAMMNWDRFRTHTRQAVSKFILENLRD